MKTNEIKVIGDYTISKKLDCTKITTLDEVKLILDSLNLHIYPNCKHYEKLKHLILCE